VAYLAEADYAAEHHLPALARIVDAEVAAVDYTLGGEDLLLAPTYAIPRLLERNGLSWQDFDYYEIHEAFAATVLATLDALSDETYCRSKLGLSGDLGEIDRSRLNVNGSSLAAGPRSPRRGGRIVPTLAKLLHQRGSVDGRPARGIRVRVRRRGAGRQWRFWRPAVPRKKVDPLEVLSHNPIGESSRVLVDR